MNRRGMDGFRPPAILNVQGCWPFVVGGPPGLGRYGMSAPMRGR